MKRYAPALNHNYSVGMVESETGPWVLYDDVKELIELKQRVRDDSLAITCQSLGQYRTALLAKGNI